MSRFIDFSEIAAGQFVKIAGKTMPETGFLAVEIVIEPEVGFPKLESLVQRIEPEKGELTLLGQSVVMNGDDSKEGRGLKKEIAKLRVGDMVKIKGAYAGDHHFEPARIKKKERLEFYIEELQGVVEKVSPKDGAFEVNGVRIHLNEKTILIKE